MATSVPDAVTPPGVPLNTELVHVYVELATLIVGVKAAVPAPQNVAGAGALVIVGIGSTVTTIVNGVPAQKVGVGPVGVTV
jgi:hypothetical protein